MVKKWDVVLLISVIVCALLWILYSRLISIDGAYVTVSVDGTEVARYDLNKDLTVVIDGINGGSNQLVIHDGTADITEASCPDKLCVHQASIKKTGETMVCLPNRVVVKVVDGEQGDLDAISQ
ncbi:MAG TPA: NusG domain II-containing protein [Lachnospiraceae bacterium]|jgi:hypothetical protein|nr:NusG domain II-containing protein [Lachnospiraceae bacterium]